MTQISKTEEALKNMENVPVDTPTIDANKVDVLRINNAATAVQFTQDVLCPVDENGKPINPRRQEDNIDFNVGHAILHLRNGVDLKINCNDWLIIHSNGSYEVLTEGKFNEEWQALQRDKEPAFLRPKEPKEVKTTGASVPKPSVSDVLAKLKAGKGN